MRNVSELKVEIELQFGANLTARQLWALTKLSKHVRMRCRNNAAFNNCFNALFPYAQFRQVQKTRADGSYYPGLTITVNNETPDVTEGED